MASNRVDDQQLALLDVPAKPDERLTDDAAARYYTMAGRCSGIPECCIQAFIPWRLNPDNNPGERRRLGYRRCPPCRRARRVVVVRACPTPVCACSMASDLLLTLPRHVRLAWLDVAEPMFVRRAKAAEEERS
jgi:hypothetical protein